MEQCIEENKYIDPLEYDLLKPKSQPVIQSKLSIANTKDDLRQISDAELQGILNSKDCADKGMSYLSSCVFLVRNISKEESKRIAKLIALGGGCLLTGKT